MRADEGTGEGGTIDCHRLDLSTCDDGDLALLDRAERERAGRFRFERDRTRYIAAHAQARRLLGTRLGLAPAAVPLTTTGNGKPVVDQEAAALAGVDPAVRAVCFNLTHSGAVGYLAIASFSVGIDVELYRPLEDLQPLIDSYCSPGEIIALAALPDERRVLGFLGVWTRKEAALKAWGTGIGVVPLEDLHVGTAAEPIATLAMPAQRVSATATPPAPAPPPAPAAAQAAATSAAAVSTMAVPPAPALPPTDAYPGLQLRTFVGAREALSIAAAADFALAIRIDSPPR